MPSWFLRTGEGPLALKRSRFIEVGLCYSESPSPAWNSEHQLQRKPSTCTPRHVSPSPGRRFLQALASQVACATTTEENEGPLVVYGNLASCILSFFEAFTLWRPSSGCVMVFFKQNENLIFGFS